MSVAARVYRSFPVSGQNILVSLYGYYWKKRRYGGLFPAYLNAFHQREYFTAGQWREYQQAELRKLLKVAYRQVPYYQTIFAHAGLDFNKLGKITLQDIQQLPYLTKEDLRKYGKTTLVSRCREPGGSFYPSSGSTGTPTSILFSRAMHQRWSAAFEVRIRHWAGVSKETPRGMIGGRRVVARAHDNGPYYRYNIFEKQTYFSAYHISADTCGDYLAGMRKYGVQYMTGYAFSNYALARFFYENKLQPPAMKAVITSSEKLTSHMRKVLSEVYRCRVFDSYSGLEACGLISECEHGSLHISPDVGILEVLRPDGTPAGAGEEGELVCTGLLNYDQPLIRYRIGDRVKLAGNQQCACGRQMPVVEEILGRTEDVVVGPDGREMVRFHGVFLDLPHVREAQIVQSSITNILVNVVPAGSLTRQERETIAARLRSQLGQIEVQIEEVPHIPRGPNGKFRAVVSHLHNNKK